MAPKFVEKWLDRGLSFPKFVLRVIGLAGTVITLIAIGRALKSLGFGVELSIGLFLVLIWALSEMFRLRILHDRYKRSHPEPSDAPNQNPINLSVLDPLTPLETPVKPPSLSDVYFDRPEPRGEPDYSTIPTDLSKLQKKNPLPDFRTEWAERDRLMQRCAGDVEEPEAVHKWINSVFDKLATVSRVKAMEFKPDQSAVTQASDFMDQVNRAAALINKGTKVNHSRKTLREYGDRLAKIEDEARNGS
jgi:hypothetical protein